MKATGAIAIAVLAGAGVWWYMRPRIEMGYLPTATGDIWFRLYAGGNMIEGSRRATDDFAVDYPLGGYNFKIFNGSYGVQFQIWKGEKLVKHYSITPHEAPEN